MANIGCTEPNCPNPHYSRGLCSPHYQTARYHGRLPDAPSDRQCSECGGPIPPGRSFGAMYCSNRCKDRARYNATKRLPPETRRCEQCGAEYEIARRRQRFCSETCGIENRKDRVKAGRLKDKSTRPPCVRCGKPIAAERSRKAVYCSWNCRSLARRHVAYGLTPDELVELLAAQPSCGICGFDDWGAGPKGPQVDHSHTTGAVRGILCNNCNNGLGRFKDSRELLLKAADWVAM